MTWQIAWLFGSPVVAGLGIVAVVFGLTYADEARGRRRALQGAGTEKLKRVERELDEVRRELRKRQTPDG